MTIRNPNRTRQGRARILAALGVTSLALIAASPANAAYRNYEPSDEAPTTTRTAENPNQTPPVDENGKKSCEIANIGGGNSYLPHGTVIKVTWPNGTSTSVKCNDGDWVSAFQGTGAYDRYHQAENGSYSPEP